MGYQHMFYGVNLDRLKSIYGSNDSNFVAEVLQSKAEELEDNDAFFEDRIAEGNFPNSEAALRDIVAGTPKSNGAEAMYGYVLKMICEHLGGMIGSDVYAIRDHPYASQLVASGPPIPIPFDDSDFPEIGFLALADIPAEIARIDAAPKRAKKSLRLSLLSFLTKGLVGKQMGDEEAAEDMASYRETLEEALEKKVSIISFRH